MVTLNTTGRFEVLVNIQVCIADTKETTKWLGTVLFSQKKCDSISILPFTIVVLYRAATKFMILLAPSMGQSLEPSSQF